MYQNEGKELSIACTVDMQSYGLGPCFYYSQEFINSFPKMILFPSYTISCNLMIHHDFGSFIKTVLKELEESHCSSTLLLLANNLGKFTDISPCHW